MPRRIWQRPGSGNGWRTALLAAAVWLPAGCPRDDPAAVTDGAAQTPAPETTPELRARAQAAALERLRPLAVAALRLDDPAFASRWADTVPKPAATTASARETLRAALVPAREEAVGIRPQLLPPQDRVVALVTRFGLDRSQDRVFRVRPSRTDPDWILLELDRVLDVLEVSARRSGSCTHCERALPLLPGALDSARADLGATSAPALEAAQAHAAALGLRLGALPVDASVTQPARDALARYAGALAEIVLPPRPNATHADAIGPAAEPTSVQRLPDRLDARTLSRRLEVEENVSGTPAEVFTSLGRSVAQLSKLRQRHPAPPAAPPTPLTQERCSTAWAPLATFADQSPALDAGDFSCESFVTGWGPAPVGSIELGLELIDVGIVETHRRAQLSTTTEVLRLVAGRIAPASQQHTMRTAVALGANHEVTGAALAREHDAACLAAAAVWIHGEVGADEALGERLTKHCPSKTPAAWIDAAEAHPRAALDGLGLARVAAGPAGLVSLDRYWWAPLGFIDLLADPQHTTAPTAATVKMNVEPVQPPEPGTASPPQPGAQP